MTGILEKVSKELHRQNLSIVSAESCTGGWLAKQMTDLSGSSTVFDRGFVTYSNESKIDMLNVPKKMIDTEGAVSESVVIAMVAGALENSKGDIAIAISGIAGPHGGTIDKPVGTVCFAWQRREEKAIAITHQFSGNRDDVREKAVDFALQGILKIIN